MRAINQLLAGVHIAAMGEALTFGISQGVDAAHIVEKSRAACCRNSAVPVLWHCICIRKIRL